jgi:DNA-binding CsgD family transcriptional regulator
MTPQRRRRDTVSVDEWPLAGRAGELGGLRERLSRPDTRGLVIAGPAGVGKTRLALEGLTLAERAGCATLRVTATRSASGLPFGALAPLLPAAGQRVAGAVDDRADLLRRSAAALVDAAGGRRLTLLVDDAHLLDDASATLVHQLAATNAAFVLVTVRTGEPAPDSIVALWKDRIVERLDLLGLRTSTVEELLSAVLRGPVDAAAAAHLAVRCHGNVLFLRELVQAGLEDGSLRDDGGIWRVVGPTSPSDRLAELVGNRLGTLTEADRGVLELVSCGEPVGPAELAMTDANLAEGLERKGLLVSSLQGRRLEIRMGHPIYGEVLRARMPALRLRAVACSLAEAVEARGARRREDALRVATWRLDGGGARPDLMLAPATTARWRYDFPLAERLARAAVEAGAGFDAALLAAELASLQGRGEEAESELAGLAAQAGNDAQLALVTFARMDNSAFYLGRIDEGIRVAEGAEAAIADPDWRDETRARRSALLIGTHGPRAAAEAAEPLLRRAKGRTLVWACHIAAYSFGRLGQIGAAHEAARQGRDAHLDLTQPLEWYPWVHVFLSCEAFAHAGRFEEAQALASAQYQQGLEDGSTEAQAWFAWHLGKFVGDRGHVETSIRQLREAVALFRQLGRPQFLQWCLPYLAQALALGGRTEEARDALGTLDTLEVPPTVYLGADLPVARAWTAVAGGDLPAARDWLAQGAAIGEDIGDLVGQATSLHTLARLGWAREVAARLEAVAAEIEGDLAAARARHARALAESDPEALQTVSTAFETMGADLLAAEAAADAAVAWRRSGQPKDAAAAERRSTVLVQRAEGVVTPALRGIEMRVRLTRAERDAAMLAAAGRSNKEIAQELYLSVRTVETRLQRIYDKLGITSRTELATALDSALTAAGPHEGDR